VSFQFNFDLCHENRQHRSSSRDQWVHTKIPDYNITNFSKAWTSGKAICALAESVLPGLMNLPQDFSNNPVQDAQMGMSKAKQNMMIPDILDPVDMVKFPNDLCLMIYIAYFHDRDQR